MKLTLKSSLLLIVTGMIVSTLCAIPKIFNRDDTFLVPGLIITSVLFLLGLIGIIKWMIKKK